MGEVRGVRWLLTQFLFAWVRRCGALILSWWTMMLSLLTKNECLFLHAASRPSTWAWYTFVVRVWLREGSSQWIIPQVFYPTCNEITMIPSALRHLTFFCKQLTSPPQWPNKKETLPIFWLFSCEPPFWLVRDMITRGNPRNQILQHNRDRILLPFVLCLWISLVA